eukprot:m.87572 g.87572  ORF g.87572 m.87572 type:complete len:83 (-) comp16412_c1_seq5:191-439(-)
MFLVVVVPAWCKTWGMPVNFAFSASSPGCQCIPPSAQNMEQFCLVDVDHATWWWRVQCRKKVCMQEASIQDNPFFVGRYLLH